jgi:aspartyl-tRNA(Asn)/glutamyl-tRNA(Gln) amidotransferase subunit A
MAPATANELIEHLQSGELTSVALTRECLDRIERFNPQLNAFVHVAAEQALERAAAIDRRRAAGQPVGRLAGLPVAVKDNICVRGMTTTAGSRMLSNFEPPYDAHMIERLQTEDAIVVGKLNLDEFAMGSSTETSIFGPARNPWNTELTAGGSSGGSAVAVSAGLVPLAFGSDTGGSIRQPAGFCGVTGLKPTYGRVSRYGLIAYASSLDQIGPLATDALSAALALDVISGHDCRDTTSASRQPSSAASRVRQVDGASLQGLRVGVPEEYFAEGLDPSVERPVRDALAVMEAAGAHLVPVSLPHSRFAVAAYYLIACSEASSNLARYDGIHYGRRAESYDDLIDVYMNSRGEGFGTEVKRRIMLGTYALSAGYYDAYYLKALRVRRRIRDDFDRAFGQVDVIAGPVAPTAAFALGDKVRDPLAMYLGDIYTISANLAGLPAICVPCGMTNDGRPVGLQLQAAPLHDEQLLLAAAAFQQVTDWHRQRPPYGGE